MKAYLTDLSTISHPQFGELRIKTDDYGQPWFVGKDAASALGYSNASKAVAMHVKKKDKRHIMVEMSTDAQFGNLLRKTKTTLINESGLYCLVLSSKLPEAQKFQDWVTSEVLPQIRQTGGYIPSHPDDDEATILARAVIVAQKTLQMAQQTLEQKERTIALLRDTIEEQRPIVDFYQQARQSDGSVLIGTLAKMLASHGLDIGQQRLFAWLRNNHYLFKQKNLPLQKWVDRGIFEVTYHDIETRRGMQHKPVTHVTVEGIRYFHDLFLGDLFFPLTFNSEYNHSSLLTQHTRA